MAIVGFNLTKINVEKIEEIKGQIAVNNDIRLKAVEKTNLGFSVKDIGIEIRFSFSSIFKPKVGSVEMEGKILLLESEQNAKIIMDGWGKNKRLPPVVMQAVFTTIIRKCSIQALMLTDELGLPSPVRLPKIKVSKQQEQAKPKSEEKAKKK